MNWEQLQGQMAQVSGKLKEKWAKLTDDDLLLLRGKKEVFLGKFQERTGLAKEEAEKQFDAFITKLDPSKIEAANVNPGKLDPARIDPSKIATGNFDAPSKPAVHK